MIDSYRRLFLLLALIVLAFSLMPFMEETGMNVFMSNDDVLDEDDLFIISNIPFSWIRIPVRELSILLAQGISIFALFVIYLGGRSKHRRFNDRTIDADMVIKGVAIFLKAAHYWAAFKFLNPSKDQTRDSINVTFLPTFQRYGGTTS